MTAFFLYFETKNDSSTDYRSFANVGAFIVPKTIDSGKMPILLHGKPTVASMISDGSNHGIADYFTGNDKHQIKDMLLAFIHARVQNDAVVANLMKFIYNNQETLTLDDGDPVDLAYAEFEQRFDPSLFERDRRVRVALRDSEASHEKARGSPGNQGHRFLEPRRLAIMAAGHQGTGIPGPGLGDRLAGRARLQYVPCPRPRPRPCGGMAAVFAW